MAFPVTLHFLHLLDDHVNGQKLLDFGESASLLALRPRYAVN